MDDLPKVGEKLLILNEFGTKLLVSLHNVRTQFTNEATRPGFLNEPNLQPVYKAILKRFPDTGGLSQVQGSNIFETGSREILEKLGEAYECFIGIVDFKDGALHTLGQCNRLTSITGETNPDIMSLFLKVLVTYAKINFLLATVNDRKLIAACYTRAFTATNSTAEPSYGRVSEYLMKYESPLERMHEELFGVSAKVGQVLGLLKQFLDRAFPQTDQLFNEGPLNMIHVAANISKPSEEGKRLFDLSHPNELVEWILYGYLLCPSELSKPTAPEFLKLALQKGFLYEVYRDELINFHQEYESMFSSYKGNIKQAKGILSEATAGMISTSPGLHQERRHFLRWQLYQIFELLSDKPGLVGPKFSLICSALSMAKDEIIWYFRHTDKPFPKSSKAKPKDDDNKDLLIAELLYLVHEIKLLVSKHKQIVQKYYLEFLGGFYKTKAKQVFDQFSSTQKVDEKVKAHFDWLNDLLSQLGPNYTEFDFEPLRINCVRLQVFLSLPTAQASPAEVEKVISLYREIAFRSRYIDKFEAHLEACGGLGYLYFERASFFSALGMTLKHVSQSQFVSAFISIPENFLSNVNSFYPKEAAVIGPRSAQWLEQVFTDISKRISELLHEIGLTMKDVILKSAPENAVNAVLKAKEKSANRKVPGMLDQNTDQALPGSESGMRPSNEMKKLQARKTIIRSLVLAMCERETVVVYDGSFTPKQFILEMLYNRFRGFLSSIVFGEPVSPDQPPPLKRPSIVYLEIEAYVSAQMTVDASVDLGISELLRDILLEHTDLDSARKHFRPNEAQAPTKKPSKKGQAPALVSNELPLLYSYCKWYIEIVVNQALSGQAIYSPLRKSFVSKPNAASKIERYLSFSELLYFCRLVGPNGLKIVEDMTMKMISGTVAELKEMIIMNQETLVQLQTYYVNEPKSLELQRRLKVEGLYEKTIRLGALFTFRQLLADALQHVLNDKAHHIYECIANAHKQYPANLYGVAGYLAIDEIANWVGIFSNVDVSLRASLSVLCQDPAVDRRVWDLLPVFYGSTISSLTNLDTSIFNTSIENNENNACCIALALNKIMPAMISLISNEQDLILNLQKSFVEIASTFLLRLTKEKPKELGSVSLILAEFVSQSKFMTYDMLCSALPYSFIRTSYADLYKRRALIELGK